MYLVFCILFSAAVLITFKFAEYLKINTFSAILINYATAFIVGFIVARGNINPLLDLNVGNIAFMLVLGTWCIIFFHLLSLSVKKAGVAITTVASKMSVIIPILFSIYIDNNDSFSALKVLGIILALVALLLTVFKKEGLIHASSDVYLPILIFLGVGAIDSSYKFAQTTFVTNEMNSIFNSTVFAVSGVAGLVLLPFNREAIVRFKQRKTWLLGMILGLLNFGSMFFMIAALNHVNIKTGEPMQGSIVFGINNLSIVLINVLIGLLFFKERASRTNWIGIVLSLVSIVVLTLC